MDKLRKSDTTINNENNIENQIFTMLEDVLKEDSDESIVSENKIPLTKNKNQSTKNESSLNFQKNEKKLFVNEKLDKLHPNPNTNRMLNINYQNNLEVTNYPNSQKSINQPQIFINNIPVSKDSEPIYNREFIFRQQKNNSPKNICKQIPHFNNLSPISKQFKNQSPGNKNEENIIMNVQLPITNRLTVAHIGMNMAYNNLVANNSPKMNAKHHLYVRNKSINHQISKFCLKNIENNSSTCTTNR
jgi:hypothetical protein